MDFLIKKTVFGKFGKDVAWYVASLVVLSLVGIVLNVLVARVYGAEALGVFNQVYAIYILLSQFAVFGIHFSVLRYVSQFRNDRALCNQIISSALILTALIAAVIAFLGFGLRGWVGGILKSPDVSVGLMYAAPGLLFFAINKVLLAVLNSYRKMKSYAISLGLRYILMLGWSVGFVVLKMPGSVLPLIFTLSEVILLLWLFFYSLQFYSFVGISKWSVWVKKHILFGFRAFGSSTLSEINTRVDVLMLGFFTTDRVVGIYSMAAILAEGLIQFSVAFRTNVNPILSRLLFEKGVDELKKMVKWGIKIFYPVMAGVGIFAMIFYPLLVYGFLDSNVFMPSWPLFCILTLGIMLSAGYLPFSMLLNQAGFPGRYTLTVLFHVLANIVFNALLIPFLGMYGAAIATALSFILLVVVFKVFVRKTLKIRI